MAYGLDSPGTYEVSDGYKNKDKVKADRLDYSGPNGELQAWKDGAVIAQWSYWQSILRVGD